MTGASTGLVCLLGNPVKHSLSPAMHNAAFRHLGMDMNYMAFQVEPEGLIRALEGLKALGCRGANVTIPYKEEIFALADWLDPSARELGAVNTLVFRGGAICGYNTDVAGVEQVIRLLAPEGKAALLLGAGGAARAAALVLARRGFAPLTITNRTRSRAERLAADLEAIIGRSVAQVLPWGEVPERDPDIMVNATSLGLDANPWPEELLQEYLASAARGKVLDLVYSPTGETGLVAAARSRGMEAQGGEGVLLYQGAEAFRLFTGREAPVEVMGAALMGAREADRHDA